MGVVFSMPTGVLVFSMILVVMFMVVMLIATVIMIVLHVLVRMFHNTILKLFIVVTHRLWALVFRYYRKKRLKLSLKSLIFISKKW